MKYPFSALIPSPPVLFHEAVRPLALFLWLLEKCQGLAKGRKKFRFKNKLYSLDASLIELCVTLFDWAGYRQTKGAVKLHLLLDHEGYLPVFACITEGKVHEVKIARGLTFPKGSILAIDMGYTDYRQFAIWTEAGIYFVTKQKDNAVYRVIKDRVVPDNRRILKDQLIELTGYYSAKKCPHILRRIEVWDGTLLLAQMKPALSRTNKATPVGSFRTFSLYRCYIEW